MPVTISQKTSSIGSTTGITLSDLRSEIKEIVGRDDKDDLIDSAINRGLERASTAHPWKRLRGETTKSLSDGTTKISLPAKRLYQIEWVRLMDDFQSRAIILKTRSWLLRRYPDISSEAHSKPIYAYQDKGDLVLIPIPDASYNIKVAYWQLHPELSSDTDELQIPQLRTPIVAFGAYWVFKAVEKFEASRQWFIDWQSTLQRAIDSDKFPPAMEHRPSERGVDHPEPWNDPFVGHDTRRQGA